MRQTRLYRYLGLAVGLALLTACGASDTTSEATPDIATEPATEPVSQPVVESVADDIVAKLQAGLERAESTRGPGAPVLWTLKDDDTTIYLFGTVHILRPGTQWRSPAFEEAFAAADKLVLEADVASPESQKAMAQLIPQYGLFKSGEALNDVLDDSEETTVAAALGTFGVPLEAFQTMKPWLVGLQMSVLQMQKAGFDAASGVEITLSEEARSAGKSFGYLETVEEQFSILAGADIEEQVQGLVFASETLEFGTEMLDALVSEWADGDVAGLGEIIAEPDAIGGDEAYQDLLVNRNKNWVPQIKAMLDNPGTVFVAVGSAHLAGPDSVVKMLRDDGLEVAGPT